jgi:hypothetical protein
MSPPATGNSGSRPPGSRSSPTSPFPPPWRDQGRGARSRRRATGPTLTGLFLELGRDPALAAAHHGRQRGREARRPPAPPVGAGVELGHGLQPKRGKQLQLRAVQGGPADPLPVTPAGGAAGGGGEGAGGSTPRRGSREEEGGRKLIHSKNFLLPLIQCSVRFKKKQCTDVELWQVGSITLNLEGSNFCGSWKYSGL